MDNEPTAPNSSEEPKDGADVAKNEATTEPKAGDGGGSQPSAGSTETGAETAAGAVAIEEKHMSPYKILDDALLAPESKPSSGRAYIQPVLLDCLLAAGLLIAMGGFTIGLFKIYITHSAEQSITQRNYKAAIAILKGAPLPGLFTVRGKDPQELLNQALYLEAMEKLDANQEDETAVAELTQIQPGSKFFDLAQEIVKDHTKPSDVQLEGRTEHEASPHDRVIEDPMPVIPNEPPASH